MKKMGMVYLVGAGPGDPELITVKGLRLLEQADVVVYDRLASRQLLEWVPSTARRIDVGKAPGDQRWPQDRIQTLLIAEARRGRRVVRLKGGDPFVFGRGGEECGALVEAGVPFEVVPGVSCAVAAPAYAGIPVTHRRYTSAFAVVTGHGSGENSCDLDWDALARIGTLVVLMGLGRLESIVSTLRAHGRSASTPVAVISRATCPDQRVTRGTLQDIVRKASGLRSPATIVVGRVAELGEALSWFDTGVAGQRSKRGAEAAREDIVA
jgi:uroporphyrin-III C-methyltransferase